MSEEFARRNYRLAVLNGILFNVGETFMDTATVLTLFVSRLTDRASARFGGTSGSACRSWPRFSPWRSWPR